MHRSCNPRHRIRSTRQAAPKRSSPSASRVRVQARWWTSRRLPQHNTPRTVKRQVVHQTACRATQVDVVFRRTRARRRLPRFVKRPTRVLPTIHPPTPCVLPRTHLLRTNNKHPRQSRVAATRIASTHSKQGRGGYSKSIRTTIIGPAGTTCGYANSANTKISLVCRLWR